MQPVIDGLLGCSAEMVGEDSLIVADLTDVAKYYARYRRRCGVEDATRGIKQQFHLEQFLVRNWRSIQRLRYLIALAFFWLNLWGEDRYESLGKPFLHQPWRLPKRVTYPFDWLATQIARFLHPRPKIAPLGYSDTG